MPVLGSWFQQLPRPFYCLIQIFRSIMDSSNCHLIVTDWALSWIIHAINLRIWFLHPRLCWHKIWHYIKNIDLFYICYVKTHLWRRMLSGTSMSEAKCLGCAQKRNEWGKKWWYFHGLFPAGWNWRIVCCVRWFYFPGPGRHWQQY